jgi:hypothetical protein
VRRGRRLDIALALASLAFALGIAELAVRALDVGPEFQVVFLEIFQLADDPALEYELRPGAPDGEHRISAAGLRDRDYAAVPPPGTFRIAVIGDSLTFGHRLPREASYPKRLETLLAGPVPGAPHFEVINLGVTGYNIGQSVARLVALGLPLRPDLVLYGYVLNDPQEFSYEGATLRDLAGAEERRFYAGFERGAMRWLAHSRLFLLARHALAPSALFDRDQAGAVIGVDGSPIDVPQQLDPGYVAFFLRKDLRGEYFRKLHQSERGRALLENGFAELARHAGSRPVVVAIFPLFIDADPRAYPLRDVHALVRATALRHGVEVIDLQPAFQRVAARTGFAKLRGDFLHPSAFGYGVAAVAILDGLVSRNLLPAGSVDWTSLSRGEGEDAEIVRLLRGAPSASRSGAPSARSR